jgi:predicted Zn-dependent protease
MAHLTRDEAQRLTQRVLAFSRAEQARVNVTSTQEGNVRFAQNQLSTAGDVANLSIVVTSAFGKRVASATTNRTDDASLRTVVETSERLARLLPEDPEYLGELGPQPYLQQSAVFPATAALTPEARAAAVRAVTELARGRGLISTGFAPHAASASAVATSKGLFGYHADTRANFTTTVRTPDGTGSGWAGTAVHDWGEIDAARLAAIAIEKAEASRAPRAVEPGKWTVILEPSATATMVGLMMGSLGARNADEGRSYFSRPGGGNRIGEKFLDERVTIASDPMQPELSGSPFSGEGVPTRRTTWVEAGTLRELAYDRYWAQRSGREPLPSAGGYRMQGGDASAEEMIRSTERGILVTRLWYIRSVDPRTILFTGLTRDGTFLIENGRIAHSVKNFRWNESPIFLLNNLEMMGPPVRVVPTESGDLGATVVVPPVKARDFTFTSLSDAV